MGGEGRGNERNSMYMYSHKQWDPMFYRESRAVLYFAMKTTKCIICLSSCRLYAV
jgi:hypothetical protein